MDVSEEHWFFLEALTHMNERIGIVKDEFLYNYSGACLKAYNAGWGLQTLAGKFRQMGEKLTNAEKASLGISSKKVIGSLFIETLTEYGVTDPEEAARAIANAGASQVRIEKHYNLAIQGRFDLRFLIKEDEKTCSSALALAGAYCSILDFPGFPLRGCDKWTCRCTINRYVPSMGGWRL